MKQINLFKTLLLVAFLGISGISNGQIHPLAFGSYSLGGSPTDGNWYANYVGVRLEVVSPAVVAGSKTYKAANAGTGATGDWGGVVTTPLVNVEVVMGPGADSTGCTTLAAGSMTGKIALLWRNHTSATGCEFGVRALNAQNAGAIAVVIINDEPGEGPVGMGAGTSGASVTIPVFMIGNLDGIAISHEYNTLPAGSVHMTITPWGQNFNNDLGFLPAGAAAWHNYAIPAHQMGGTQVPYNMIDGAFIANFGNNPQTGVKLKSNTYFTPTGGSTTSQHSGEVDLPGTFTVADSIWAMFKSGSEYSLTASGPGRFDVNYIIEQAATDDYPADNQLNVSFYVSDSVFSKGTYNFTTNEPSRTSYNSFGAGAEYIWGPMYYVANGGNNLSSVQYSIAMNISVSTYPVLSSGGNNIYVFKWNDGTVGGFPADSVVENGELELVGLGVKTYNSNDTSGATLWCQISSDLSSGDPAAGQIPLSGNTWYYVAVDVVPASSTDPLFLGCDGVNSAYPRIFGRFHNGGNLLDYSNMIMVGDEPTLISDSLQGNPPLAGGQTALIASVDSFVYSSMTGLIPAVAMITNNTPNSVKPVAVKPLADVTIFPNPAKDQLNVSASFGKMESTVSYEIIDGLARFVSKETHNNVKDDTYTVNTSRLAAGQYYLIINAEGKALARKFVVTK